jgi:hypothetical protein
MSLTMSKITELAPDQESLNAASKLIKPGKWLSLRKNNDLVWGDCQGSGANPYRTVFDNSNAGYKCTCPSRKFPCKHVLALMWMFVEDARPFVDGEVPPWVTDWLGRRRTADGSSSAKENTNKSSGASKSLVAAQIADLEKPLDPQVEAKRKATGEKRAQATQQTIAAGLEELQQWLGDQLRSGLASFLNDPTARCRTIAARLVDAKAQAMAGRIDELPSRLIQLSSERRLDALLQELGRVVLLCRAWLANPNDPELARLVGSTETRESLLSLPAAPRASSTWEVVGEQVATRRDGLVSQATWLLNLGEGTRFAVLLDYFPASLGKRGSAFAIGEQFAADLVYYPARYPLRAVIAGRELPEGERQKREREWPAGEAKPLVTYREALRQAPWLVEVPLLLPCGRIAQAGANYWWQAADQSVALPLLGKPAREIAGLAMQQTAGIWDGVSLTLLSGQSDWGRWSYDN